MAGTANNLPTDWKVLTADARAALADLPSGSVHCAITSPPYWGHRRYDVPDAVWGGRDNCPHQFHDGRFCDHCGAWRGALGDEPDPDLYCAHLLDIFSDVRRVLRPDASCWLVVGDTYAKQDFPDLGLKRKDLVGIPWQLAFQLRQSGWQLRSSVVWHKPNAFPEPVKDRPTMSHEYVFLLTVSGTYYYDPVEGSEPALTDRWPGIGPQHGAARRRGERYGMMESRPYRNLRTVWTVSTAASKLAHAAVFPESLVDPMIRMSTSGHGVCADCGAPFARSGSELTLWTPGCRCAASQSGQTTPAVVLDPFSGSGTVGAVALQLGRSYIGIDASETYNTIARSRLGERQLPLLLPQ